MNIFVGSLPFKLDEGELRKYLEKFGEVSSVKIITDKFTGRSKGFGFVEMPDDEAAKQAIDQLNGTQIGGRDVVVNKAEERKEGGGGGGGRKNFGSNRGGGGGGYKSGGGGYNSDGNSDRW